MAWCEVLGDLDIELRAFSGQDVLRRVSEIEDDVARALDRDVYPEFKNIEGTLIDREYWLTGGPSLQVNYEGPGLL